LTLQPPLDDPRFTDYQREAWATAQKIVAETGQHAAFQFPYFPLPMVEGQFCFPDSTPKDFQ